MSIMTPWGGDYGGIRSARPRLRPLALLIRVRATIRQRRRLSELPDYLLEDIGVTPDEAHHESGRAFWDLPRTTFHRW